MLCAHTCGELVSVVCATETVVMKKCVFITSAVAGCAHVVSIVGIIVGMVCSWWKLGCMRWGAGVSDYRGVGTVCVSCFHGVSMGAYIIVSIIVVMMGSVYGGIRVRIM